MIVSSLDSLDDNTDLEVGNNMKGYFRVVILMCQLIFMGPNCCLLVLSYLLPLILQTHFVLSDQVFVLS